jgi:putative transposase
MFVIERFLSNFSEGYGKHPVSSDGGTWYPQACKFLKLDHHHINSSYEKSITERTINISKIELNVLMTSFQSILMFL